MMHIVPMNEAAARIKINKLLEAAELMRGLSQNCKRKARTQMGFSLYFACPEN